MRQSVSLLDFADIPLVSFGKNASTSHQVVTVQSPGEGWYFDVRFFSPLSLCCCCCPKRSLPPKSIIVFGQRWNLRNLICSTMMQSTKLPKSKVLKFYMTKILKFNHSLVEPLFAKYIRKWIKWDFLEKQLYKRPVTKITISGKFLLQ